MCLSTFINGAFFRNLHMIYAHEQRNKDMNIKIEEMLKLTEDTTQKIKETIIVVRAQGDCQQNN